MQNTLARLRAARRDNSGFTLIELLIVIIILGVLAAVVVFSVRGITDNGEEAACKTEVRIVDTAIEAFYADRGVDPADVDELVAEGFLKSEGEYVANAFGTDGAGNPAASATAC